MRIVAFIPIKLNNERLPGKNIMKLNGKPLCNYLFETLNQIRTIDKKYVYCSNPKIKEFIPNGLEYMQRDISLDQPETKGLQIIDQFVREVDADIYVLIHVTQPYIKSETIQNALNKVISGEFDSAFSAREIKDYMWYQGKTVNYNLQNIVRTQDLEPMYMETGAFFIFRKEVYTKLGQRIGNKPYIAVVNQIEAIDIDTQEDFCFAEIAGKYLAEHKI